MLRKSLSAVLAACVLVCLLSSCSAEKVDSYAGESNTVYQVVATSDSPNFTIDILPTPPATSSNKHLICGVTFELTDASLSAKFDAKPHRVKEIIINTLRSRTREELEAVDAIAVLGEEITSAINAEFNTEGVEKTYFSTFFIA